MMLMVRRLYWKPVGQVRVRAAPGAYFLDPNRAPPVPRIFDLVNNTNTHAARTRTGAHEAKIQVKGWRR